MLRLLTVFTFVACCALQFRDAWAGEVLPVIVAYEEPSLHGLALRVRAELRSAGRQQVVVERRTPLAYCAADEGSLPLGREAERVQVLLWPSGEKTVEARICARFAPERITIVAVHGRLDEENDFSIVITEALHGLLAAPEDHSLPEAAARGESMKEAVVSHESAATPPAPSGAFSIEAKWVVDVPTGGSWGGVSPSLEWSLGRFLRFEAEMFFAFLPVKYSDAQSEVRSHLGWARWGISGAHVLGPVSLGYDVAAGPYWVRATALATAPHEGGRDGAFGVVLFAGGRVDVPSRGRIFLRGSLGVSVLVPRIRYQLAEEVTPTVGKFMLEGGLGLGIRFRR